MLLNDHPDQFSLRYDPAPCEAGDTVLCFQGDQVLLLPEGVACRLPVWRDVLPAAMGQTPMHAFTQGARRVFLLNAQPGCAAPEGLAFESVRVFRALPAQLDQYLLVTAYHLAAWYAKHRFCGACGGRPAPAPDERALVCPQCGLIQYPVIAPAVIVAVTDGDRLLLARNAKGAFRLFTVIAGFVEVGETLEQTVEREVFEEVGLHVRDIRYIASQPWGFTQSMMVGFHARLNGAADITLQTSELSEAGWFRADELPEHAGSASIAYMLIDLFRQGKLA